ncbi:hypothetical protein Q4493_04840 [Colwellia sp. 1_MG-2023]|uniref:hypothetical protein n=1 Tax=Colwellia sp. 1_MG-2023 TaxID=3062649 RepID=UPI0026E15007|nr:hypothetical protein [Colwellia sp. 1_MG-2023]MDO6445097.1 hypothetical protein [Colwellia sp. 1_MG-2023]
MSPNEGFVMSSIVEKFGGRFTEGENPPDSYFHLGNKKIAVEVTRLVQQVQNDKGVMISRLAHDQPAMTLSDHLDNLLKHDIPDDKYVFLILGAPINNIRKTKSELKKEIISQLNSGLVKQDLIIEKNKISICIHDGTRKTGKKVISAIANRYSDANLLSNIVNLLSDRITSKLKKCKAKAYDGDYWLALYNDYWVADIESYRFAYSKLNIQHDFNKILIIDSYGQVECI